jgi:hypothetical protein
VLSQLGASGPRLIVVGVSTLIPAMSAKDDKVKAVEAVQPHSRRTRDPCRPASDHVQASGVANITLLSWSLAGTPALLFLGVAGQ